MTATAAKLIADAVERLKSADVEDAAGDAWRLLSYSTEGKCSCAMPRDCCTESDEARSKFERAILDRMAHRPVSQIVGRREFYKSSFLVDSSTLDPRPETETLVKEAVGLEPKRILDLGTGSGCVLLSILSECPGSTGVGVDCSKRAVGLAQANAKRLGIAGRAEFAVSDWFSHVTGQFDLIVSNPPYVSETEYECLSAEIRKWEPKNALTLGGDGTQAYRCIAESVRRHMSDWGRLLVEISPQLLNQATQIFAEYDLRAEKVAKDLNGQDRVVILRHSAQNLCFF